MGCLCESDKKEKKNINHNETNDDKLSINAKKYFENNNLNDSKKDNKISKKNISINAATFVNEKRFKDFLQEYDLGDLIGKGINRFIFLTRCFWDSQKSVT